MKTIYYSLSEACAELQPSVATVGFFDGVHLGHRYVVSQVMEEARRQGLASTVITFERHPRQVVHPEWKPQLLTTLDEKQQCLEQTGIDQLVVLRFDVVMAALTGREFMEHVLSEQLQVRTLLMGYDNQFGRGRTEGMEDFRRYGQELGMPVRQLSIAPSGSISSTHVRQSLSEGDVAEAFRCMGRPYTLSGRVVVGEHIGTAMGFPTANLEPDAPEKLLPAPGVYAVTVQLEAAQGLWHGMMNIGTRPTFDGQRQTLETHIFQYEGSLYGQRMTVSFVKRLRDERRFSSMEALTAQLRRDAEKAETILNKGI